MKDKRKNTSRQRSFVLFQLFCVIVLLMSSPVAQAKNFLKIYQSLLESNPEYQAELIRYKASKQIVVQARAGLLPQVSLTGTYGIIDEKRDSRDEDILETQANNIVSNAGNGETPSLSGFSFEGESVPTRDEFESNTATLRLVQPIFDRGRWSNFKVAKSTVKESKFLLEQIHEQLFLRLTEAYFGLASIDSQLLIIEKELEALREQTNLTEDRHKERLGNLTDVYETNSRLLTVKADRENFLANRKLFETELIELIGEKAFALFYDNNFIMTIGQINEWIEQSDVNNLQKTALLVDTEVNLAKQRIRTARYQYRQQNSGFTPRLSLEAQSSISKTSNNIFADEDDRRRDEIMLRLDIPIFSGFDTYSRTKEAYLNIQSAKETLRAENDAQRQEVSSSYANLLANKNRVSLLEKSFENITKAVDLRRQGYLQGLSTNLNFLESLSLSFANQRQLVSAKFDYISSWVQVLSVTRNLDRIDAVQIDSLLK